MLVLRKRKQHIISGNFSLYRIASGKKEYGLEFLETNKNDYDW